MLTDRTLHCAFWTIFLTQNKKEKKKERISFKSVKSISSQVRNNSYLSDKMHCRTASGLDAAMSEASVCALRSTPSLEFAISTTSPRRSAVAPSITWGFQNGQQYRDSTIKNQKLKSKMKEKYYNKTRLQVISTDAIKSKGLITTFLAKILSTRINRTPLKTQNDSPHINLTLFS